MPCTPRGLKSCLLSGVQRTLIDFGARWLGRDWIKSGDYDAPVLCPLRATSGHLDFLLY